MKGKIAKVKNNHKKPYDSKGGKIYIHAVKFEGDNTPYEVHSKTETCKYTVGEEIEVNVEEDKFKNKKIKMSVPFTGGGYNRGGVPSPSPASKAMVWAVIFNGLCTLAAPKGQASKDVAKVADTIYAKIKDL